MAGGKKQYYLDMESALYLLGGGNNGRYYDAATGRFLSEDPTKEAGGDENLFRYAGNDPVNNLDPSGHVTQPPPTPPPQQPYHPPQEPSAVNPKANPTPSTPRGAAGDPNAASAKINAIANAGMAKVDALTAEGNREIQALDAESKRNLRSLDARFKKEDANDLTTAQLESANQVRSIPLPKQYIEVGSTDSNEGLAGKLAHLPIIGNLIDAAARINTARITGTKLDTPARRAIVLDALSVGAAITPLAAEDAVAGGAARVGVAGVGENIAVDAATASRFSQLREATTFLRDEALISNRAYRRQIIQSFGADLRIGEFRGQAYQYSASGNTSSRYLTPIPLNKPIQELALPPSNPATAIRQYRVAPTRVLVGSVARQNFGFPLRGGAKQIFVPSRSVLIPTPLLPGG